MLRAVLVLPGAPILLSVPEHLPRRRIVVVLLGNAQPDASYGFTAAAGLVASATLAGAAAARAGAARIVTLSKGDPTPSEAGRHRPRWSPRL
mgnify:CR=1 FL=1